MNVLYVLHKLSHFGVCLLNILIVFLLQKSIPHFMSLTLLTFLVLTSGFWVIVPTMSPHFGEIVPQAGRSFQPVPWSCHTIA